VAVLREVKYLQQRGTENIPGSAGGLYEQNDMLLKYVANLDLTVTWYNKIRETVLEVEYPIIEAQLKAIDSHLHRAEHEMNWTIDGGRF
jgi:dynein heavy chain